MKELACLLPTRRKGLYRLQPPAIRSPGGDRYEIGLIDRFYIGRAHRYIRTKEKCIGGPGRYKIGQADRSYIGRLGATLSQGAVADTTPFAV
jgi:hypothetical protein